MALTFLASGHALSWRAREPMTDELIRRRIVLLIYLFFWLLPIEGVLRKWIVPDFQGPLIFIRDPVAIAMTAMYVFAQRGRFPIWFILWFVLVIALLVLAVVQSASNSLPLIVFLIGIRNYLLFIPIAFVMAHTMNVADLRRLLIQACWLAIPVAGLVALQFSSPVASAINKGLSDDVEGRFTVVEGIVRPYGPFTFVLGQAMFGGLMVALTVIAFEQRRAWKLGWITPLACAGGTIVMGALSGSRTFFALALVVVASYMLGSFSGKRVSASFVKLAGAVMAVLIFGLVFTQLFPRAYDAMSERQVTATQAEGSTVNRAFSMLSPFPTYGADLSLVGEGMGVGSNAGSFTLSGGRTFLLSEYEVPRVFQEAGVFGGGIIILTRLAIVAWLLMLCVAAGRRHDDTSCFALFGVTISILLTAPISGQNQMISFCWFSVGLCAALAINAGYRARAPGETSSLGSPRKLAYQPR